MTHLSMSEGDVEWGEHVGDREYHDQRQQAPAVSFGILSSIVPTQVSQRRVR
jgi:hypothetical protein